MIMKGWVTVSKQISAYHSYFLEFGHVLWYYTNGIVLHNTFGVFHLLVFETFILKTPTYAVGHMAR